MNKKVLVISTTLRKEGNSDILADYFLKGAEESQNIVGQMKTLLDRTNPLFPSEYQFKDIYLLATAADTDERAIDRAIMGLEGWIECFENSRLKGVVRGVEADVVGSIMRYEEKLREAYELGKNV